MAAAVAGGGEDAAAAATAGARLRERTARGLWLGAGAPAAGTRGGGASPSFAASSSFAPASFVAHAGKSTPLPGDCAERGREKGEGDPATLQGIVTAVIWWVWLKRRQPPADIRFELFLHRPARVTCAVVRRTNYLTPPTCQVEADVFLFIPGKLVNHITMWELLFWDLLGREKKKMKKRRELLKIRGNLTAEANHGRYMCMAVAPLKLKENSIAPWIIHRTDFLRKMHSHVICDLQDEGQRLDFYVEGKELISEVSVPGSESTLRISTEVCRAVLFKIIKRFQSMHSAGFSLGGFEHKILFVTSDFEVKIGGISRVKDFTKTRGSKDYKSIGKIAREVIFSSVTNLPVDIEQLLDLLTDNPMEQTALLGMHYSLLDPLTQVSEFLWWHKRLIHLKDINPEKFQRIMENIPTGNNWMSRAVENKYIRKELNRTPGQMGSVEKDQKKEIRWQDKNAAGPGTEGRAPEAVRPRGLLPPPLPDRQQAGNPICGTTLEDFSGLT
uniref:Uncharacterized protein n=1 Tax=Oryza meridionalis TaxID=40149 RepID=A0A0E0CBY2_9ORYZ